MIREKVSTSKGFNAHNFFKTMNNTELTLDQLTNVSGAAYRRDFCIDPLVLKLIISGQKIPTILKGKSLNRR